MKRRVVITGMGAVTPLGKDVPTLWKQIKVGKSGIRKIEDVAFAQMDTQIAGFADDFNGQDYMTKKEMKTYDKVMQYGYVAAKQALEQADFPKDMNKDRAGVYVGSGAGGLTTLFANYDVMMEKGARRVSPFTVPVSITNMVAGFIAMKTGFRGPSFSPSSACATGNHAIGEAYLNIAHGYSDVMLAGGAEAPIHPMYFAGFTKMKAMSTRNDSPETASRPFDEARDGFVMGEGAGVLVLEDYEHAKKRGAKIIGEIVGYGATTDAYHMTTPDTNGAVRAMELAIERANISTKDIHYINAHGTSTAVGDISETKAIQTVFSSDVEDLKVSSSKSMTGHLFGAAGGVEAIITAMAVQENVYPPTINLEKKDPVCTLDYVANTMETGSISYALSNGFGFGGHNAVLVFKKISDRKEASNESN